MSKPLIAITQRVAEVAGYSERRDALDQRWYSLFARAGLLPLLLPNQAGAAVELVTHLQPAGLLLSGGNSLVDYHGDAPERDAAERALLSAWALPAQKPVLGVSRGMQLLSAYFEQPLVEVKKHVSPRQTIEYLGQRIEVNSYQTWGSYVAPPDFEVLGRADDGVIKAMRHQRLPLHGIMWHPERIEPFRPEDVELLRHCFASA